MHGLDPNAMRSPTTRGLLAALLLLLPLGCQHFGASSEQRFATPQAAAEALFAALDEKEPDAILAIFGREYEHEIVTPDWDAGADARAKIASEGREQLEFQDVGDGTLELVIGGEQWPFPMPLVQGSDGWHFETEAGIQELIDRRIGRNELAAIAILQAYVDAQIEYATQDRNGDGMLEYAQRLASTPGEHDGLYWETAEGEPESPLGPLVASAERYLDTVDPGDPIRGYYFQILKSQGPNAPSGARDYLVDGRMITGFGLVAVPAEYGSSGIMTFVVSHRGDVYQKDLGGEGVTLYDPDESWTLVED